MKLREVKIKNFRNLADVSVPINDTTILVGENNSGKTAFLDALRIVLTRTTFGKSSPFDFDEYDYYMDSVGDTPQSSEGITIELWFQEDEANEWPDSLVQALTDIIQIEPTSDIDSIGVRVSSRFDEIARQMTTKWEFLALDGQPLGGRGANPSNLNKFLKYIRLFYLSALRNSNEEFSARSQYWGKILRDMKIDEDQKAALVREITKLNDGLLKADARLEQVRVSLDKVQKIMAHGSGQATSIQALPLKPWDLMSKSEVVVKSAGNELDFPLSRHGHGTQSLCVLFLFQAYIDVLLRPLFFPETEAILALEEPEAHLHPQASRALAANLCEITSQKIISSHSPYFLQEIPFPQIRMFRRNGPKAKVLYLKRQFKAIIPAKAELLKYCDNHTVLRYDEGTSTLIANSKINETTFRELLTIYSDQKEMHPRIRQLYDDSLLYLNEEELGSLNSYVKRIRGEILFARAWLLCEGQSEYVLLRYFADLLNKSLDSAGISIIDFQNNGSPSSFAVLARIFEIPWVMICDNDDAGLRFIQQVKDRGLTESQIAEDILPLPGDNVDLERYLMRNGFSSEYVSILTDKGIRISQAEVDQEYEDEVVKHLQKDKTDSITRLIDKLRSQNSDLNRVPDFLKNVIEKVFEKAKL